MKINLKAFLFMLIIIFTLSVSEIVKAENNNYEDKIYKVGLIDFSPYAEVDENGVFKGYYVDFFDLIAKELDLKYEYVLVNNLESIEKIASGEIDFSLGITITASRAEKVIFSVNHIALEKLALYTNKDIDSYNLNELNGLRFGAIRERATDWILDFFKASNINVELVYGDSYEEINRLLDEDSIDLILDSAYKKSNYKKIYEFIDSQVYIAANKSNKEVLNAIDRTINRINSEDPEKIENLYNSYFEKDKVRKEKVERFLNIGLMIISIILAVILLFPIIKRYIYKEYVKFLIRNNKYLIYYKPIYKFKTKEIIGGEALIKDKLKDEKSLNSKKIISFFESKNGIAELCIWQLEKIASKYNEIIKNNSLNEEDFYISLNIPINQFKNIKFFRSMINILNKYKLNKNSICIEVMGNINVRDIEIISGNIKILKEAGFLIAIDDFGIEYSNLNIIQDLDIDIIKIDKIFTENMDKSIIRSEIIMFISRIAKAEDKFIVLEGIDKIEQEKKIKEIDNDKLCVQGNLYDEIIK